jgi:ribosome maturation protein Sdo1
MLRECWQAKLISWRLLELQIQKLFVQYDCSLPLLFPFLSLNFPKEILEKGDLQVTELERQALIEGMFRDVATIVSDKSVNPETDRPYTISMIQNAMKDIHYSVTLNKNAKQQALDVIRRLRKVMPIARVLMSLKITLALSC